MRTAAFLRRAFLAACMLAWAACAAGQAQPATGNIEFTAHVRPTDGRPEPVRILTFYLLRKSFAEIQAEAEKSASRPDRDKFIDGLNVSPELKAWMKRTRIVNLSGTDFMNQVKVDDIMGVPEFFEAYVAQNAGDTIVGFPKSRAKDSDREKNPQKYEQDQARYKEALRNFIAGNPHTRDGLEVRLVEINPAQKWQQQDMERRRRVRLHALELAETQYLAAKTDTDLEGHGSFLRVAAGNYWLSSLEGEGVSGDARLRWDAPVPVQAGRTTRVALSNVNAVK